MTIKDKICNLTIGDEVKVTLKDTKTPTLEGNVSDFGDSSSGMWICLSNGLRISEKFISSIETVRPTLPVDNYPVGTIIDVRSGRLKTWFCAKKDDEYGTWLISGGGGASYQWRELVTYRSIITVVEPRVEPQWVETEADYKALPDGSIVATDGYAPVYKYMGVWMDGPSRASLDFSKRRKVLRVGSGK